LSGSKQTLGSLPGVYPRKAKPPKRIARIYDSPNLPELGRVHHHEEGIRD
jgi:hypothetical protein